MATKSMAYDHPAYTVPGAWAGSVLAGASTVSQRFVAHASLQLKSINYTTAVIGTGAATDAKTIFILPQGTATTTVALFTTTAAIYATNALLTNSMSKGDILYLAKGTDATEVGAFSVEWVLTPGASITV